MKRYTVDANALIDYFLGILPTSAHQQFGAAADGRVTLELPAIAATETIYIIERRDELHGIPIPIGAGTARQWIDGLPLNIVEDTYADFREVVNQMAQFPAQIHDAMIVSNHLNNGTDAIITDDEKMEEEFPTIWS